MIGFEPHPKIFSYLSENLKLNKLENKVQIHNCALGKNRGTLNFSSVRNDDTNKVINSGRGINVPVNLLDDMCKNYSSINLIKIDVEGYEKYVVEGGLKTINKTDCVYFEMSEEQFDYYGYSIKDLLTIYENMGFRIYLLKEQQHLELINRDYRLKLHHTNAFAIRNIEDFIERTGWKVIKN